MGKPSATQKGFGACRESCKQTESWGPTTPRRQVLIYSNLKKAEVFDTSRQNQGSDDDADHEEGERQVKNIGEEEVSDIRFTTHEEVREQVCPTREKHLG